MKGSRARRVMEIESWLTDVYGPRLTNSPNFRKAGDWAVKELTECGLVQRRSSSRGVRSAAAGRTTSSTPRRSTPTPFPIIGYPKAWTNGTNGLVSGEAVHRRHPDRRGLREVPGQAARQVRLRDAPARGAAAVRGAGPSLHERRAQPTSRARPTRARAAAAAARVPAAPGVRAGPAPGWSRWRAEPGRATSAVLQGRRSARDRRCLGPWRRRHGVRAERAGRVARHPGTDAGLPQLTFAVEHYGRLVRAMEKDVPVRLELDVKNTFYDDNPQSFNVVARDPGHRQGRTSS